MRINPQYNNCCGCMACKSVCPTNAISFSVDSCGFIFPKVNESLCVECSKCSKVCAYTNADTESNLVSRVFAFQVSNKEDLINSTSGGAFTALSDMFLKKGGYVAACVMDDRFNVFHFVAENEEERNAMRYSKYVQSNTDGIFGKIEELLSLKKEVLFVGTPCQAAQIKRMFGKFDNLFICDFLCHGVPGNKLFKDHIEYLENRSGKKIENYLFRGKKFGWNHGIDEAVFSDKTGNCSLETQVYTQFFQKGYSLRESCMNCRYRSKERYSDITIGDFWGIEKLSGTNDYSGTSLIIVNSQRGEKFVSALSEIGILTEYSVSDIEKRLMPVDQSKSENAEFRKVYEEQGYSGLVNKYADLSMKKRIRFTAKKILMRRRIKERK